MDKLSAPIPEELTPEALESLVDAMAPGSRDPIGGCDAGTLVRLLSHHRQQNERLIILLRALVRLIRDALVDSDRHRDVLKGMMGRFEALVARQEAMVESQAGAADALLEATRALTAVAGKVQSALERDPDRAGPLRPA